MYFSNTIEVCDREGYPACIPKLKFAWVLWNPPNLTSCHTF